MKNDDNDSKNAIHDGVAPTHKKLSLKRETLAIGRVRSRLRAGSGSDDHFHCQGTHVSAIWG